jgi:flagella basal body P-ring formation protein FlgA
MTAMASIIVAGWLAAFAPPEASAGSPPAPRAERPAERLDPARLLEAMRRALPGSRIEILDFLRAPVPEGDPDFPLAGLRQTVEGELWLGAVRRPEGHGYPIWAKVKVVADQPRVIVVDPLRPGAPIAAGQVRLETRAEFPAGSEFAASLEEVVGRLPLRAVAAGTPLRAAWLAPAHAIARGDTVFVEVSLGGVRLAFEAQAEASGSTGQTIPLRNPANGRRFYARVEGPDRAAVKGTL